MPAAYRLAVLPPALEGEALFLTEQTTGAPLSPSTTLLSLGADLLVSTLANHTCFK